MDKIKAEFDILQKRGWIRINKDRIWFMNLPVKKLIYFYYLNSVYRTNFKRECLFKEYQQVLLNLGFFVYVYRFLCKERKPILGFNFLSQVKAII